MASFRAVASDRNGQAAASRARTWRGWLGVGAAALAILVAFALFAAPFVFP